jgi:hypothetical protein
MISKIYLGLAKKYFSSKGSKWMLPCYASFATLTIDAYTNVRACDPFHSVIGNLRENRYDIVKLLKTEKAKRIRRRIEQGECPGCWISCEAYPTIIQNFPLCLISYKFTK